MSGHRTKNVPSTTTSMSASTPTAAQVQMRCVVQVCVTRNGTLLSRMGRNSDRMVARATALRRGSRRRRAEVRPVKAFVGGERSRTRAGCGSFERRR